MNNEEKQFVRDHRFLLSAKDMAEEIEVDVKLIRKFMANEGIKLTQSQKDQVNYLKSQKNKRKVERYRVI